MPEIVIANDLPYQGSDPDPFEALRRTLAFSARDWGEERDVAWIYGVVFGWGFGEEDAHPQLAAEFGWTDDQVTQLRTLHAEFEKANALYRGDV